MTVEGRSSSEELLPLTAIRNVHNSFDCSTTGNLRTCFEPSVQAWILYKAPQWNARYPNSWNSGNGAARPPKQCVWVSWAERARALDEAERNSSGDEDGGDLRAR